MSSPSDRPGSGGEPDPDLLSQLARADVGVVRLTPSGDIVTVNEAFVALTGRDREQLRGTSFASVLATVPQSLASILSDDADGSVTLTLPVETADEGVVDCEAHLESVTGDEPAVVAVLYRRSAQSTRGEGLGELNPEREGETASAKAFVALADALSDGIIVLDTASEIQYANPAVERILGHAPDELVGGSKLSIIPERLREDHLNALDRYIETGRRNIDWEYVELPGQHADGREVPLGISLNDFVFEGERYFVGLFRDISPRKEAKRELRERERRLNRYKEYTDDILNAIDDVFYVLDTSGNLRRWNQRGLEVTGYTEEEIESMNAIEFFEEDEHEYIVNAVEEGFRTGHNRIEANLVTKDGESIPYEFVGARLEDPDGEPVLAGIGRDVSERERHRRRLEESNERLEQFAYAASHDLQEPLRMITSYLRLIDQRYGDVLDEEGEEFIEFAVDGAERMREMIDGLLKYSRVDTQGEPLEPVDLDAVLDQVLDDLQIRIRETDAEIDIGTLPVVSGDRGQLRQVFQNLLTNAIQYSGDDPPRIDVSAERDGSMWRISIRDEGEGIDPEQTDRIFQVFQRLHTRDEHAGSGLGLALVQRIVERHGGRIRVESEPGEGSTFSFTLADAS